MASENPKIPNSAIAPFALRMQPNLKAALEEAASASGRSLNAEIVARLEQSLSGDRDLEGRVDNLEAELKRVWEWLAPQPQSEGSGLAARIAKSATKKPEQ